MKMTDPVRQKLGRIAVNQWVKHRKDILWLAQGIKEVTFDTPYFQQNRTFKILRPRSPIAVYN